MLDTLICREDKTLLDVMGMIQKNGKGIVFLVNDSNCITGILTDGDIRKSLLAGSDLQVKARTVMNKNFIYATISDKYSDIVPKFSEKIKIIPVIDENHRIVDYYEFVGSTHLPIARPDFGGKELQYVVDAFFSTWISSTGKYIELFENAFAHFCGCKFGVAVSNGTVALHLALKALGIGDGDEVIVPDLTFAATINAVLHAGATPVIVDIEPESWCIAPKEIKKAITSKTKAIIPVHLYGQPCDMDAIMNIAHKYKLFVIEDCAEAHGATFDEKRVGGYGNISCFSFYGNKVITTGEGGMCLTNSAELNEKMRVLRDHGMSRKKKYWHEVVGYNYRMTNLQAAIGLAQVERLDEILAKRKAIEEQYKKALKDVKILEFQRDNLPKRGKITWLVCVLVKGYDRDKYIVHLESKGMETRPFFYPLSEMKIYKKYVLTTKNSVIIAKQGICLPTFSNIREIRREWFDV